MPSLEVVTEDGKPTGISRRYLKVRVTNDGDIVARRCRAKLKVTEGAERHPSDTKFLCWDSEPERFIDIGADDDEPIHVVFAESDFPTKHKNGGIDMYALASTVESLYPKAKFIKAQDAFGLGEFTIKITVRDEGGSYTMAFYKLEIKDSDKPFNLTFLSHKNSINVKKRISRLLSRISHKRSTRT